MSDHRLSDESRLAMFRQAGEAERANRPRWMVGLALLVLAAAALYALLGWSGRSAALRNLRSAQAADVNLSLVLDEIQRASRPPEQGDAGPFDPLANPRTLLEQFAERAGLDTPPPPTTSSEQVADRISRRTFRYNSVRNPSPEELIGWLDSVERGILGMRVESLDLRPNSARNGWELSVTFSRLEKSS